MGLKKTFWTGFVAFTALQYSYSWMLKLALAKNPLPNAQNYGIIAASLILGTLISIVVWRSSSLYEGRKTYKYFARFWVVLQLFGLLPLAYCIHLLQQHPL